MEEKWPLTSPFVNILVGLILEAVVIWAFTIYFGWNN